MFVFVYGTLKQGYGNHRLLANSRFVSFGHTKGQFKMYNTGFPVVLAEPKEGRVVGEVYEIDPDRTLPGLDRLESNGHMYTRHETDVELLDGSVVSAWMYVGEPGFWHDAVDKLDAVEKDFRGEFCWSRHGG